MLPLKTVLFFLVIFQACCMLLVASPALTFPPAEISLGEVVAGNVGERVVELGNSGDAALHVSKVRACCGASAVLETPVLPPGTKGRLTVSYRPLVPSGEFRKTVYIHSDDPARPIAQLEITGTAVAERRREPGRESPAVETTPEDRDAPREADRPGLLSGTMLAVVLAGIADGFNPCAFSIVIVLAGILAVGGRRRRARLAGGISFCVGSYLTYMAMGLGLMTTLKALDTLRAVHDGLMLALAVSLFVLSALSFRDAFRYRRLKVPSAITLQLPDRVKRMIRTVAESSWSGPAVALAGLGCGFLVTILDSLCTGQIYVPVLALIAREPDAGRSFAMLAVYNLAFIAPLVAVFVLAAKGADSERMSRWSKRNVFPSKLGLGLMFLVLGFLLLPWHRLAPSPEETPADAVPDATPAAPEVLPSSKPEVQAADVTYRAISDGIARTTEAELADAGDLEIARLLAPDGEFAPGVPADRVLALRNQLLDRLVSLDPLPDGLPVTLARIVSDPSAPIRWREYCLQVIPECVKRLPSESRESAILQGELMKALDETRTPLAGTALQGLDRLASAAGPSGSARLASIVRKSCIAICADPDPGVSPATRAAALRLAGQRGYIEALPDAERLSRTGPNEFVRKCAEKTLSELHDTANR